MTTTIILALGAFSGGLVSGLAGFGNGLTALGFWLHVVNPAAATVLVAACSVLSQSQSIFTVRRSVSWRRAWPFLAGGILGVPIGAAALPLIEPKSFKLLLGVFLIGYSGWTLGVRNTPTITWGGRAADGVVGLSGGAVGGLTGLAGVLPTIWCGLRGWNADTQRAVYQPFNLAILATVLGTYAVQGSLTAEVWRMILVCIPATVGGTFLGVRLYGRVNDRQFRVIVLWLLLASGVVLTASNVIGATPAITS